MRSGGLDDSLSAPRVQLALNMARAIKTVTTTIAIVEDLGVVFPEPQVEGLTVKPSSMVNRDVVGTELT